MKTRSQINETHNWEGSSESERWPQQYSKEDDVLSSVSVAEVPKQWGENHVADDEGRLQQAWLSIVNRFFVATNVEAIPFHILQLGDNTCTQKYKNETSYL